MMYLPKHLRDNAPRLPKDAIKCVICGYSMGYHRDDTLIRTTAKGVRPKVYAHKRCLEREVADES